MLDNMFIRPMVPHYKHMIEKANKVNAMLLNKGVVTTIYCKEDFDYSDGVASVWNSPVRNLWIIEHDIVPTIGVIEELELCPYLACVPLYWTISSHTGLSDKIIPHRFYDHDHKLTWISANMEWADAVGFGCVKFNKLIRHEFPMIERVHWQRVDHILSHDLALQTGQKFHVHNVWVEHDQI